MTIQCMIMNKGSLILSSDLAVTMEDYKSYVGVKKVFELKNDVPAGIMINGFVNFENIPLETLIGEFKNEINNFESVEKIKNDFINFLSKNTNYTSSQEYLKGVLKSFKTRLCDLIDEDGFEITINNKSMKEIPQFVRDYHNFDYEFNELIPPGYDKIKYNLRIWKIFAHELTFEGTGVIIAGFDKIHHYPSFFDFNIYCNDNGEIIFEDIESKTNCEESLIRVFAMNEEAYSFISGVSDDFENSIKMYITKSHEDILKNMEWLLKNENIKNYDKILFYLKKELNRTNLNIENYINNFKSYIISNTSESCEYLPRQLLCDFADSLIKLTSLKQKFSLDLETVSKESDIVLITKSDNLKWVKYTEEII